MRINVHGLHGRVKRMRQIRKVAGTEPAIERSARVGLKEDHHVL